MYYLNETCWFPDPSEADQDGLLAVGGDLSSERLLLAYHSGVFPWYEKGQPALWWSPDPRMVLFPKDLKVSKSLQKTIKSDQFRVTFNENFSEVIRRCSSIQREGQDGTWITNEMITAYEKLHAQGHALSVEVWENDVLVGGLYGVDLPTQKVFCGESMFSSVSNASKVGFYHWVQQLVLWEYKIIDCQLYTQHLERLGAVEIARQEFLQFLKR